MSRKSVAMLVVALVGMFAWPTSPSAQSVVQKDRERIRAHLKEVEAELRSRDVSHLPPSKQRARERNLDRLRRYRKAGVFPHNDMADRQTPIFIDREGRDCAVAHLMQESGWEREARAISRRENLERLPDMKSPEVGAWLEQSGLTAEEATMIQPSYSPCRRCGCEVAPVCGKDGTTYLNACTAEKCANVDSTAEGCCELGADPVGPGETDDPYGTRCDEARTSRDTGVSDDTGGGDAGSRICSNSRTPDGGLVWDDDESNQREDAPACASVDAKNPLRSPLGAPFLAVVVFAIGFRSRRGR